MFSSKMGFLQSSPKPGGPVSYLAILCIFRHGGDEGNQHVYQHRLQNPKGPTGFEEGSNSWLLADPIKLGYIGFLI